MQKKVITFFFSTLFLVSMVTTSLATLLDNTLSHNNKIANPTTPTIVEPTVSN